MTLNPVILFTREYLVTSRIPIVRRGVYVTKGGGVWSQIRAWEDGTPNRSRVSGSTKGPDCQNGLKWFEMRSVNVRKRPAH